MSSRETSAPAAVSSSAPSSSVPTSSPPSAPPSATVFSLEDLYLYHNAHTGAPSAYVSPLSLRQLCRVLCPARPNAHAAGIVTPDTLVIGYDPPTGTYSPSGWVKARDAPVLAEACAPWHYLSSGGGARGPATARELSRMLHGGGESEGGEGDASAAGGADSIDGLTRVWSSGRGDGGWKALSELPLLRMALEALAPESEPSWTSVIVEKKKKQTNKGRGRWGPRKPLGAVDTNALEDASTLKTGLNEVKARKAPAAHPIATEDDHLRQKCMQYKREVERMRKEQDEYQDETRHLRNKLDGSKEDVDYYRDETKHLRKKLDQLKDDLYYYQWESRRQTERADAFQDEATELKARLRVAEETVTRLIKEKDEVRSEHNVTKSLLEQKFQDEATELKARLRVAEETVARLIKEKDEVRSEHNVTKSLLERKFQDEATELKARLRVAEETVATLIKEKDVLRSEHNVTKSLLERKRSSKRQTRDNACSFADGGSLSKAPDKLSLGPELGGASSSPYLLHECSGSTDIPSIQAALKSNGNLAAMKIRKMGKGGIVRGRVSAHDGGIYLTALNGGEFAPFEIMKLKKIFGAIDKEGFAPWLKGERGWRMGSGKAEWGKLALKDLNDRQRQFKLIVSKNEISELRYSDPEGDSKEEMWLKRGKLIDAVKDVRSVLELLQYFNEVARPTNDQPGILTAVGEEAMAPEMRWSRIADTADYLMRNGKSGPDAPVHWAAHAKRNTFPLTVVTKESLAEITSGLDKIFKDLFFGRENA